MDCVTAEYEVETGLQICATTKKNKGSNNW